MKKKNNALMLKNSIKDNSNHNFLDDVIVAGSATNITYENGSEKYKHMSQDFVYLNDSGSYDKNTILKLQTNSIKICIASSTKVKSSK